MDFQKKRINRALLIGWTVFVIVLFIMYMVEVARGDRTVSYMVRFSLCTILPELLAILLYLRNPESEAEPYFIVAGFMVMYGFALFTGHTFLVFTYILPMLSLLVLCHNPKLIVLCGIGTAGLNIGEIACRYVQGGAMDLMDKDFRIRIFILLLCFAALYAAASIYDSIYQNNLRYGKELLSQKEELREMAMQTIMTIANTIDAKDEYTRGHSRRVSEYSAAIAQELGYAGDELRDIRFIGLLHDIGKIGVPDNVLNKPGRLTDEEYQLMKDHTTTGGEILKDITMIKGLDVGAKYHHERFDGKGYPEGLKGDEIPEIARIIGVADAYDAMTSNRVYRHHLELDRVVEELEKGKGKQFDPRACSAILKLIREERLPKFSLDDDSIEVKQATKILTRVIDKAEETAVDDVHYDELTNTLSREHGMRLIQNAIAHYGKGSLFIFDLDHFRSINEQDGFATGDRYLSFLAEEIQKMNEEILVSRFGSDEFVAYLPQIDTRKKAEQEAEQFIGRMRQVAADDPAFGRLSVSIGITQAATEKDRVMILYENASKALFVAKQYGQGSYFCHRLEMGKEDDVAVANSADLEHLVAVLTGKEEARWKLPKQELLYETMHELIRGNERHVSIVLFTLRETGAEALSLESRDELMELLAQSIQTSIRGADTMLRYSNVQHVLLLIDLDERMIRQAVNKILASFYRANVHQGIEVHYDIADIA